MLHDLFRQRGDGVSEEGQCWEEARRLRGLVSHVRVVVNTGAHGAEWPGVVVGGSCRVGPNCSAAGRGAWRRAIVARVGMVRIVVVGVCRSR